MKVVEKMVKVFIAKDGSEFLSEEACNKYDKVSGNTMYFSVKAYPDLTEGRHGPRTTGVIAVNAERNHKMFAEHAAYVLFGNRINFVQGYFGSNSIITNWILGEGSTEKPSDKIIATVQDSNSSPKAFSAGVKDLRGKK